MVTDTRAPSTGTPAAPARRSLLSVLYPSEYSARPAATTSAPAYFPDLHLDQIVADVLGSDGYQLAATFYYPLRDLDSVRYRQDVFDDLEKGTLAAGLSDVADIMRTRRAALAQAGKLRAPYQREWWILEAARRYAAAVNHLVDVLKTADLTSRALLAFRDHVTVYSASRPFAELLEAIAATDTRLGEVEYLVRIRGTRVTVSRYDGEDDYSEQVHETFSRFKHGESKDYGATFAEIPDMNNVEAQILGLLGRLFPDAFSTLDQFAGTFASPVDEVIGLFDQEIQFYLSYRRHLAGILGDNLRVCRPVVGESKDVFAIDTFDLALASKLHPAGTSTVTNSFRLTDPERVIVVSGPNQGGKTTFARTFGQLHYLAALGCPVPGSDVCTFLFDDLFTHFEREEDITDVGGKLEEDLNRIKQILDRATSRSIMISNEIFTSTTLHDARFLGTELLRAVIARDVLCVYVTFVDELSTIGPTVVSMVSTVDPATPARRTFTLARRPADGLAYALVIAEQYGVDYRHLRQRITTADTDLGREEAPA